MVKDDAQLYTIEGIAAGVLMVVTAYLVISTTTVLTPQDTHIVDMQLEQIGQDALTMTDYPESYGNMSILQRSIYYNDTPNTTLFDQTFLNYCNNKTSGSRDTLSYNATVYYNNNAGSISSYTFPESSSYYRENAVKVSKWTTIPGQIQNFPPPDMRDVPQVVRMEVLLWR